MDKTSAPKLQNITDMNYGESNEWRDISCSWVEKNTINPFVASIIDL